MEGSFKTAVSGAAVLVIGVYIVGALVGAMPAADTTNVATVNETVGGFGYNNSVVVGPVDGSVAEAYDNETVTEGGIDLTEGTDYEYHASNNTLVFLSGGSLTQGDVVEVTLYYRPLPDSAAGALDTFGSAFTLGAVAVLVLFAALILAYIGSFGRMGGGRR
jgi:hypothetical protein